MVRSVTAAALVGLLLAACGGAASLTDYAEGLEEAGARASSRFDLVNGSLVGPDATLAEARSAVKEAVVIGNDLHAELETLDPPDELVELHAVLLELHRDVLAAQQEWAESANTAQSVAELLRSPQAQAALSSNEAALAACSRIQDALDATADRAVFDGTPWLPSQLKESVNVALGCPPASTG